MSEGQQLSPEQCLARIRDLDVDRESLIRRQAAYGEKHDQAQRELQKIIEQMKAAGTSPQTIQADLTREADVLVRSTVEYQQALEKLRSFMDGADRSLAATTERKG